MSQFPCKLALLITSILAFTVTFGQSSKLPDPNHYYPNFRFDRSQLAILQFDSSTMYFFSGGKADTLSKSEISELEKMIVESINNYNASLSGDSRKYFSILLDKRSYRRQYVCARNRQGEKEVFVNFFCMTLTGDWRKSLVFVDDGGTCFFNLKINLATKKYYDFFVNGYA